MFDVLDEHVCMMLSRLVDLGEVRLSCHVYTVPGKGHLIALGKLDSRPLSASSLDTGRRRAQR